VPCDAPSAVPCAWLDGSSRSKALSSQGSRAFSFSRAATRVISNLFASSGAKVSRVGDSVLPLRGRVFLFFLEGEHHVYSKRSQCVSTDWRSARRPIRAATFDRADACHLRAAPRSEATRPKPSIGCTRSTLRPSLRTKPAVVMIDRYRKKIAAMVIQMAKDDPQLVKEMILKLRRSGEIEADDLRYLERIAERWIEITEENLQKARC